MAKINDNMRGRWHFTGQYWFCDCYRHVPLLNVGIGQGGSRTGGRAHAPSVGYCSRCQVYRPLKRDRPSMEDALGNLGIEKQPASEHVPGPVQAVEGLHHTGLGTLY